MDILSPDDLKVDTEYYLEFQSNGDAFIKYNGTYILTYIHKINCYGDIQYRFKTLKNRQAFIFDGSVIVYNTITSTFKLKSSGHYIADVSITDLTTGYILK